MIKESAETMPFCRASWNESSLCVFGSVNVLVSWLYRPSAITSSRAKGLCAIATPIATAALSEYVSPVCTFTTLPCLASSTPQAVAMASAISSPVLGLIMVDSPSIKPSSIASSR